MSFETQIFGMTLTGQTLIQILMAFAGSLGFAMMFDLRRRFILPSAFAGMCSWIIYLACMELNDDILISSCIASISAGFFSEAMARICHSPANQFLIITLIPLIPGAPLYYTMAAATHRDAAGSAVFGCRTLQFVLGLCLGICMASAFVDLVRRFLTRRRKRPGGPV